jgi:hypothetical protein
MAHINERTLPLIHPILALLGIVLEENQNLTMLNVNNPLLLIALCFNPSIPYTSDLSELLPPEGHRWWENLRKHH